MSKRIISLLLCIVMLTSVLASCDTDDSHNHETSESTTEQPQGTESDHTDDETNGEEETTEVPGQHTHTSASAVIENLVDSTCKKTGSYDEVVYCSTCNEEISRTQKTVDKKAHDYSQKVTTSTYLKIKANCTDAAVYYYSCACGEKGTTTFAHGAANDHSYVVQNIDTKYEKTPASALMPAVYWKSCACGKASTTETFTHGDVLPGYLTYQLSPNGAYYIVTGFVGNDENITIPYIYDSLPVLGIMASAFKDNTTVKSIGIPNSIKEIGSYAFAGCTSLESVAVPTSVKNISEYTFSGCTALKAITLHSGIEVIGVFAFENCTALKSVTLSEGLLTISDNAFVNCSSLEGITIPDTVTTLGNMAFRNATSLKYVNFSKALESIGNATFNNCINLESVELHEDISTLGSSAFSGCKGLKTLRILGDLESIGSFIFYDCSGLTSIYYASRTKGNISDANYIFYNAGIDADGITLTLAKDAAVPDGLFAPCGEDNMPKIVKIIIEDGATKVSFSMTYNKLPYLTEIVYPSTVTDPCYGAFNNSLWWENQQTGKVFINGVFYGYKCHCQISSPSPSVVEENRVEATCEEDGSYDSVMYCSVCKEELSRKTVILPAEHQGKNGTCTLCGSKCYSSGLNFISNGDSTCYVNGIGSCTDTYVYIPKTSPSGDAVTSIGDFAFKGCSNLIGVTIPDSVMSIGDSAFYNCTSLTSITLPFTGATPDATSYKAHFGYIFGYKTSTSTSSEYHYYYYDSSISSYRLYFYYIPTSLTTVVITGGTKIGTMAFYNCTTLTSVTIPDGVTSICQSAFYGCNGLTSITIPDSVTNIDRWAFEYCTGLTEITIPESVKSIQSQAFQDCDGLTSITVASGNAVYHSAGNCLIETASNTLILGCKNSVIPIDGSVISIGRGAFAGCISLTSIAIPDSVISIDDLAFYECTSLTSVTIGKGVTSIHYSAFANCTRLKSITFEDTTTWYKTGDETEWENKTGGTQTSVTNAYTNASNFVIEIDGIFIFDTTYYWYKL